jgi:type I restriction enzyme S subunit
MPKDLVGNKVSVESIARIGQEDVSRLSRHKLKKGDIVYARRGDIGRRALITGREVGWMCGTGCMRISLGDSVVHPVFLHYYLGQPDIVTWIYNQAVGATMPNLNTSIVRSIPITYPLLPTQRKIAAILSAYDALIENNTRRIGLLEHTAHLLYREWFVHFRFPGHDQIEMVGSELGAIPVGWKPYKLGDLIEIQKGKKAKTQYEEPRDDSIPYLLIDGLRTGKYLYTDDTKVRIAQKDDVIMVMDGASSALVFIGVCGAVGSTLAYFRSRSQEMLSPYLLYMFLQYHYETISANNVGSAIPHANKDFIKGMNIALPPAGLNRRFHNTVSLIYSQVENLKLRNTNLRATRDLLLPRLISGQLDVSDLYVNTGELDQ